jgi:hypothetical protein
MIRDGLIFNAGFHGSCLPSSKVYMRGPAKTHTNSDAYIVVTSSPLFSFKNEGRLRIHKKI